MSTTEYLGCQGELANILRRLSAAPDGFLQSEKYRLIREKLIFTAKAHGEEKQCINALSIIEAT